LNIYYFSKNIIDQKEVGIFLVEKEFDGTEYTFDMIKIDNQGKIEKIEPLANSWSAAECIGYTRAKLDYSSNKMYQEVLEKCYDDTSDDNQSVDSIIKVKSLDKLNFKTINIDTIK
jgi:hypothetical protein